MFKIKENLFDALITNSPDAIAIADSNGILIEISARFLTLFGYSSEESNQLIGSNGFKLLSPEGVDKARIDHKILLKNGILNNIEGTFVRKDGSKFIAELSLSVVNDQSEKPEYIIAIIRDITERKNLEISSTKKDNLLKESEVRFRVLVDNTMEAICIHDKSIIIEINKRFEKLFGYDRSELIGMSLLYYTAPESIEKVRSMMELGIEEHYTASFTNAAGESFFSEVQGKFIPYEDRMVRITTIQDITDDVDTTKRLLETEQNYRRLYETAQVGFWTSRMSDSVIIRANDKAASILGLARARDIINMSITNYFSKDLIKNLSKLLIEFGTFSNFEAELKNMGGGKRIVSITAQLYKANNEGYIEGFIIDITNLKQIQNQLKGSQEMFQLVLNNIPQFIFWKDKDSKFMGCNENFARVAGVETIENIKGKMDKDLVWEKEEAEFFHETDALVIESDTPEYHIIEQQLQADGKHAWLDTNKIPLHDSENNVVGLLGTYEDITERINAEIALKKSESMYREAYNHGNLLKDLFSHDINNILQSISTANEIYILESKRGNYDELSEITDIIRLQINRGAKLVNNIRKLTQLEELEQKLISIDVDQLLEESINTTKTIFFKKKIVFRKKSSVSPCKVQANQLLIDVFDNILLNAIIYNENPIIKVKINLSRVETDNLKYIKIEFRDNGVGIEDIRKETIFQRIENKNKTVSGLGLGLSLVKKIIEIYNGKIWVEDVLEGSPSKGSCFIIQIPEAFITLKF